jgi:hypothetical protein
VAALARSAAGAARRALTAAKSGAASGGSGGKGEPLRHSRLGHKLSDLTTRRVIIGVWCILLVTPLFDAAIYPQSDAFTFERGGLAAVNDVWTACIASAGNSSAQTLPLGAQCSSGGWLLLDNYRSSTSVRLRDGISLMPPYLTLARSYRGC